MGSNVHYPAWWPGLGRWPQRWRETGGWGGIEVEAGAGGWALIAKTFLPAWLCVHHPGRGDARRGSGPRLTSGAGRALNLSPV